MRPYLSASPQPQTHETPVPRCCRRCALRYIVRRFSAAGRRPISGRCVAHYRPRHEGQRGLEPARRPDRDLRQPVLRVGVARARDRLGTGRDAQGCAGRRAR